MPSAAGSKDREGGPAPARSSRPSGHALIRRRWGRTTSWSSSGPGVGCLGMSKGRIGQVVSLRSPPRRRSQTSHPPPRPAGAGRARLSATGPSATTARAARRTRRYHGAGIALPTPMCRAATRWSATPPPRPAGRGQGGEARRSSLAPLALGRRHRVLGRPAGCPPHGGRSHGDVGGIDLLRRQDAHRPGQPALGQAAAERRRLAVLGVGQHAAEGGARRPDPVQLIQRDPPLRPAGDTPRHAGLGPARGVPPPTPPGGTGAGRRRPAPRGGPG